MVSARRFLRTVNSSDLHHGCFRAPDRAHCRFLPASASCSSLTSLSMSLSTPSAAASSPTTLRTTAAACSVRPARTSHLGVSGILSTKSACAAAGTAPRPTIHRHPDGRSVRAHPTRYAAAWPSVTNSTLTVTSRPR